MFWILPYARPAFAILLLLLFLYYSCCPIYFCLFGIFSGSGRFCPGIFHAPSPFRPPLLPVRMACSLPGWLEIDTVPWSRIDNLANVEPLGLPCRSVDTGWTGDKRCAPPLPQTPLLPHFLEVVNHCFPPFSHRFSSFIVFSSFFFSILLVWQCVHFKQMMSETICLRACSFFLPKRDTQIIKISAKVWHPINKEWARCSFS